MLHRLSCSYIGCGVLQSPSICSICNTGSTRRRAGTLRPKPIVPMCKCQVISLPETRGTFSCKECVKKYSNHGSRTLRKGHGGLDGELESNLLTNRETMSDVVPSGTFLRQCIFRHRRGRGNGNSLDQRAPIHILVLECRNISKQMLCIELQDCMTSSSGLWNFSHESHMRRRFKVRSTPKLMRCVINPSAGRQGLPWVSLHSSYV